MKMHIRKFLSLLLFSIVLVFPAYSNQLDTLKLEKMVLFEKQWKYHQGDNAEWANTTFPDSDWETVNSLLDLDSMRSDMWNGISWFRYKILVDPSARGKIVGLHIVTFGASEIYFNGKLAHKFGKVSSVTDSEKTYYTVETIPIQLDSSDTQVIAVRYSNHQGIRLFKKYGLRAKHAGFGILLEPFETSVKEKTIITSQILLFFGITIALAVLHLFFFLFYSRQKENLYYSLFTGTLAYLFLSTYLTLTLHFNGELYLIYSMSGLLVLTLLIITYNLFLYSIFYPKMPKQLWGFIIFGILLSAAQLSRLSREWIFNFVYIPFIINR